MEQLKTEAGKYRTFSASQINKFYSCPRMWAYEYIEGMKPAPTYAMTKGTFIHTVVENFNEELGKFPGMNGPALRQHLIDRINTLARRAWKEGLPGDFEAQMRRDAETIRKQLINYVDTFIKRFQSVKRRTDLSVEQAWKRSAPTANELSVLVTDEDGEWMFRGDIDSVFEKHPLWFDRTAIIDYKTGKSPFNAESPLSVDYGRQLDIYAWLYYQAFGHIPEVAGIHFLSEPPTSPTAFVYKEIDPGTVEAVHLMLTRVRSLATSGDLEDYPRNEQFKWCSFEKKDGTMLRCDHWDYCLGGQEMPPPPEFDRDYPDRTPVEVVLRDPLEEKLILSEHAGPVLSKKPFPEEE
ncbi:MAG: RecB family exonuclease [bacterium]